MKLALILFCVFFISTTGQTTRTANPDDINSRYRRDNSELFNSVVRNTQENAIDSESVIANSYLIDDYFISAQPKAALLTHDDGRMKGLDYFDAKWVDLARKSYHAKYTRSEISATDSGRNGGLETSPNPSYNYFDEVISWMKNTYRARVAKDNYGSTRLLLLSFGLVGLVGIRRKFKKSRSTQNPGKKKQVGS